MNHLNFQIILFASLLIFTFYIFRLRTLIMDRIIFFFFVLVGAVLIINPDLSTIVAKYLGIGRGADLVFYIFIIISLFFAISTNARQKHLQRQITLLIRQIALSNPIQPDPKDLSTSPNPGGRNLNHSV